MNKWISVNERLPERELLERMHRFPKISLLMLLYVRNKVIQNSN